MVPVLPQKINGKPRILVAPLDWGLGHATRIIPIVKQLLSRGMDVFLAGEGAQEELLRAEFPSLPFLNLKGYRVAYSRTAQGLPWKILWQLNHIQQTIKDEHLWLKGAVEKYELDAVISDNRFGLYHSSIPTVFITHQLSIRSGFSKWAEKILQKWNYRFINRFSECWIPDIKGENNIAAELSHPEKLPSVPVHYIGLLSRFDPQLVEFKKGELLIILSGPEPQRSILEEKIITEIAHYNGHATVLRGLPGNNSIVPSTNMIKFYNHLDTAELKQAMMAAEFVISRSGYSTIMDTILLRKKCIFIPTPGQPEQEYLARELSKRKMAFFVDQKAFSLQGSITAAEKFPYELPGTGHGELEDVLDRFLRKWKTQTALG